MCADSKISALSEATALTGAEDMVVVQTSTKRVGVDTLFSTANAVWHGWTYLTAPLTSTSFDGDAFSTTAKTIIDLSTVFGAPASITAVIIRIAARDSASAATINLFVCVSATNTAGEAAVITRPSGRTNDYYDDQQGICPCDASGDIYYQVSASGAGTMDIVMQIWGYSF